MAITIPAKFLVQPDYAMTLPSMGATPLDSILKGGNFLYAYHCPALASHAITDTLTATSRTYVFPISPPSVDGLRYSFLMPIQAGAVGTCDVDITYATTLDPAAAVWNALSATIGFGVVNGFITYSAQATLPTTATMIRIILANKSLSVRPTHIYIAPDPDQTAAPFAAGGVTTSGFRPYDGSLLGTAGNPVNTELVDRCWRNPVSIVKDRKQVVATYLAPQLRTANTAKAPQTWAAATGWVTVGKTSFRVPKPGGYSFKVKVLADATGGLRDDLVEVSATAHNDSTSVMLDATTTVVSANFPITTSNDGWVDLVVRIRATAGNSTYLSALTITWEPEPDASASMRITGDGYNVIASSTLLTTAKDATQWRGVAAPKSLSTYADVGHMCDWQTTGRTTGQLHVAIPRAMPYMRYTGWQCHDLDFTVAAVPTTIYGTTDGSIANPAVAVRILSAPVGNGTYWDCQATPTSATMKLVSGPTINAVPVALQDRQLAVTEDLVGSVELIEIQQSAGFCMWASQRTIDPSAL